MSAQYFVRWKNWGEDLTVLDYDRETREFSPAATAPGDSVFRMETGDNSLAFIMLEKYALFVSNEGIAESGQFINPAIGGDYPKIEFCRKVHAVPEVLGSLSATGRFSARSFIESDTLPEGDDQFVFLDAVTLNSSGLTAASLREAGTGFLNASDEQRYFPLCRPNPDGEIEWYLSPYFYKSLYNSLDDAPIYLRCRNNPDGQPELYLSADPGWLRMAAGVPQVRNDNDQLFYAVECYTEEAEPRIRAAVPGVV